MKPFHSTLCLLMSASFFRRRASIFLSSSTSRSWSFLGIMSVGVWEETSNEALRTLVSE